MNKEIGALTGLRGIAALWVFACHLIGLLEPGSIEWKALHLIGAAGYLGVDLFFVLSGFVLAYNYAQVDIHRDGRTYATFLSKRLARIYPVHLVTLALIAVLVATNNSAALTRASGYSFTPGGLIQSLALVHAWSYPISSVWNAASWSISAEWAAYLVFPLIAALAMRIQTQRTAAMIIVLLYVLLGAHISHSDVGGTMAFGMARIAVGFTCGVLICRIWSLQGQPTTGCGRAPILGLAALIAGANLQDTFFDQGTSMVWLPILACLSVYLIARSATSPLSSPILMHLGRISYSLYMVHAIVILTMHRITGIAAATAALFLSLAAAHVLYRFIEVPCRRYLVSGTWSLPLVKVPALLRR